MIILALDALDSRPVQRYKCRYLKQMRCGPINVSEFTILRTVALWASFLSGSNMDAVVPRNKETQWLFQLKPEHTFLRMFDSYSTIDVPAFSFKQRNHAEERQLMREAFADVSVLDDFEAVIWRHHDENKRDFFKALCNYDLVMGYFDLVDAIGHLSCGVPKKMKEVYGELNAIAKEVYSSVDDMILIVSDHGMFPVGRYGDHRNPGFYSVNSKSRLRFPKITDFHDVILEVAENVW